MLCMKCKLNPETLQCTLWSSSQNLDGAWTKERSCLMIMVKGICLKQQGVFFRLIQGEAILVLKIITIILKKIA